MLTLRFAVGERVHVGVATIHVRNVGGQRVELAFEVPADVVVERGELHDRRAAYGMAGQPLAKRVSAQESHKRANYEAKADTYCHLYDGGVYQGLAKGPQAKLGGRMTHAEAEAAGRRYQDEAGPGKFARGYVLSDSPSPTGRD